MANSSILAAFERLWQHVTVAINSHTHDDLYYTEPEIDTKVTAINEDINKFRNGGSSVARAISASTAGSSEKASADSEGNVIVSTYETKTDASTKLTEAKSYADSAATKVKNDLLNGAGTAYDTLKELGELIDENVDAIDALEIVAASKSQVQFITWEASD